MKISDALTLLCVGYVAGAVKTTQNTAQLTNIAAAVPGASISVRPIPGSIAGTPVVGSSQTVTAAAMNPVSSTVNHGVANHLTIEPVQYPGFLNGAYGPYSQHDYLGYINGGYPSFHGGAYHGNFIWAYPGLGGGVFPGSFNVTSYGFLGNLNPGLLRASRHGLYGGAYSRYFSEVHPGLSGMVYGSLYLSPGLVPLLFPGLTQQPVPLPGISNPGSVTTNVGNTAISQSELVIPSQSGSAIISDQQQNLLSAQTHARLVSRRPE